mmetsp:Transcript_21515/g.46763  ORF Transcript_21515/g.46763 Transcript_21515/m.46763 type:complete len:97 (-) Transcript_21515:649-939(-)
MGRSASLFNLAFSDEIGDNVSGKDTHANMKPPTRIPREKIDTPRWLKNTANIGDRANPIENPARTKPKDGARHIGGITSDKADRATAIQLTKPDVA